MRAVLFLALVAVALAARAGLTASNPSQPSWPAQFSASVMVNDDTNGQQRFFRWFYSANLTKDRFDGPMFWNNEMYFATQIFDHVADQQYDVFAQLDEISCFSHAINGTIPKPDLTQMVFIGNAVVGYENAYHWIYQQNGKVNVTWQYFDTQDTREPIRIDVAAENQAATWQFWEFDDEPQDPSLYSLPTNVLAQCNAV